MKLKTILISCLLLASLAARSQVITYPNNGLYGLGYPRFAPIYTLYVPTGCGVPSGKAGLQSPGQQLSQAALFFDSCGHHFYIYDPSVGDTTWTIVGSGGGGSGTVTGVYISNDSLYYTTGSGNVFIGFVITPGDSTVKYVTPTQLTAGLAPKLSSISTQFSVTGAGTPGSPVQLVGDLATPGNSYYYGTNSSGAKGYTALPSGVAGADPAQTISGSVVNGSASTFMRSDAAPAIATNSVTNTLLAQAPDSTIKGNPNNSTGNEQDITIAQLVAMLSNYPTPIWAVQGLGPLGTHGDSLGLGITPFYEPDTIKTAGWPFLITGLPSKSTALSTDSLMIETLAGQLYKLPVPSGGGGSPTLTPYASYSNTTDASTTGTSEPIAVFNLMTFVLQAGSFVDSSTDVTVAFQKAIDTTQKYGGILVVPSHNYITSNTLYVKAGKQPIRIEGISGATLTYETNFTVITSTGGSRIINTSLTDTGLVNNCPGTIINNLQVLNNNPNGTASTNVGIYWDSSSTCTAYNVWAQNFNQDLIIGDGVQYHYNKLYAIEPHQYGLKLFGYTGLDAGDGRIDNFYSFPMDTHWSTADTDIYIINGGGIQFNNAKFGGALLGVDLDWAGFSDVQFNNCSEEAVVKDMTVKPRASTSISNFQISGGNYTFSGTRAFDFDGTNSGASAQSLLIAPAQVTGPAATTDTAFYLHGNITHCTVSNQVATSNVTAVQVDSGIAGNQTSNMVIQINPGSQSIIESTNMTVDLHNGSKLFLTQANALDTINIVNSGYGNDFTLQVGATVANAHIFLAGAASANYAQGNTSFIYMNPATGKATEIQGFTYGSGSVIITSVQTQWTANSIPFVNANGVMTQDNGNLSYTQSTTTLAVNNLTVANNPIFNTSSTAGYVWTATNTTGSGHWAASSGGGSTIVGPNLGMTYPYNGNAYASSSVVLDTTHKSGLDLIQFNTTNTNAAGQGLLVEAGTAATSGTTQYPGSIWLQGNYYNLTALASQTYASVMYATGTGGSTINQNLNFGYSNNGGTLTAMATMVPGTGWGFNNTNPGTIIDAIQFTTTYGEILHYSTSYMDFGVQSASTPTGSIVLNSNLGAAGATFFDPSGDWRFPGHVVAGTQTDPGTAQNYSISTTLPQYRAAYDATHYADFKSNSAGQAVINPAGVTTIFQAPISTAATINLPAGTYPTSPNQGDLGAVTGHLYYRDQSTTYDLLATISGMTNPMTTTGDMIYSSSGSTPARLGIGSNGNIMMVNSGLPSWQAQTQITSLGTIATGTWNGTGIGATYGGTGMTGFTAYGVFYANNSSAMTQTSVNSSSTPMTLQQVSGAAPAFSANGMVVASGNVTAQTVAYANVAQYTVPGSGGANTYRIGAYIKITAVVTDIIETQVTFTDEGGTSQTLTFFPMGLTTATISTTGFVGYPPMDIRVQQGSTIFVKTTLTVGTGSITYDLGGSITQLN
jgi:hypothetical protein